MIKFEKVNRITDDLQLPERSTSFSAGYDFFNPEEVEIQAGQIKYVKLTSYMRQKRRFYLWEIFYKIQINQI